MTIYLAFTVRGNRSALAAAREVSAMLQQKGHHVLTTHLLQDDPDGAESAFTDRDVYERDIRWLESADLLIAEASGSSYGVGFEVGYVLGRSEQTGQRVLLVYSESRRSAISRFIAGARHPACTVHAYREPAELVSIVQEYLSA